jgi:hypothetical protein
MDFNNQNIQNDFIYKLIDYYLEEISTEPSDNIIQSIVNIVDTMMSFYLLAQNNGVTDITNSRKMLSLKINNITKDHHLLNQFQDLESLEKNLLDCIKTTTKNNDDGIPDLNNKNHECDIPLIEELLKNHEKFMSEISRQSSDIKSVDKINFFKTDMKKSDQESAEIIAISTIDKITSLENKLNKNIELSESVLKNKLKKSNFISQSAIEIMAKQNIINDTNILNMYTEKIKNDLPKLDISIDQRINKLDEAFKRLYSRLNSPLINLIIAAVFFKITTYMFGFS